MTGAGEFKRALYDRLREQHRTGAISIAGPREGVNFSVAPDWDGYTSTTTERPAAPPPVPSRQVRRAEARRYRKAWRG